MNQSSVIFFFLFAAYFVFITARGELPLYMGFLLSAPKAVKQDTAAKSSDATTAADYASYAETAAEIAAVAL